MELLCHMFEGEFQFLLLRYQLLTVLKGELFLSTHLTISTRTHDTWEAFNFFKVCKEVKEEVS